MTRNEAVQARYKAGMIVASFQKAFPWIAEANADDHAPNHIHHKMIVLYQKQKADLKDLHDFLVASIEE